MMMHIQKSTYDTQVTSKYNPNYYPTKTLES